MNRIYGLNTQSDKQETSSKLRQTLYVPLRQYALRPAASQQPTSPRGLRPESAAYGCNERRDEARPAETERAQSRWSAHRLSNLCTYRQNLASYRVSATRLASALALFAFLWHCGIEMDTPVRERTVELDALVVKFIGLRSAAHLRARLLRGLAVELIAVYRSGLTLKEIWKALGEHGYQGSYPQFCKTCGRIVGLRRDEPRPTEIHVEENLLPQKGERVAAQGESSSSASEESEIQERGKPAWQRQREEVAARLDREAEEYRRREASKVKPRLFTNQPFEPPR